MNKRVRSSDGKSLGHVFEFHAKEIDGAVYITHLVVGAAAWTYRLALRKALGGVFANGTALELPWEAIQTVDREVKLKDGWDRERCKHNMRNE
jgi:hypothetical protein